MSESKITFLISTLHKTNKMWGTFYSRVWKVENNEVSNITETLWKAFNYKDCSLKIPFGSGTWYMRIKDFLEKEYSSSDKELYFIDVSPEF